MGGSVSSGAHLNSTPTSNKIVSFNDLVEKKLDCSWTEIDITKSSELDSSNLNKPKQSGGSKQKKKKSVKKNNRRKRQKKRERKTGKRRRRR